MLKYNLTDLGLSPDQTQIYLSLLQHGPQTASKLAQTTTVKRTYVYRLIQELEKQNLVSIETKGKITTFHPLSPSILQSKLEAQQAQLDAAQSILNTILPSLTTQYQQIDSQPVVSYHEGIEAIKKTYFQINRDRHDILLFRSVYDEHNQELSRLLKKQIETQVKLDIHTKTITPLVPGTKITYLKRDKNRLVDRHITKNPNLLLPSQIVVFGDKVAVMSLKGKLSSTIIENTAIAQTFRRLFYLLWELTKQEHLSIIQPWVKARR